MAKNDTQLIIEDARIIFRNFEGKEGKYNRKGDRNFAVIIPTEELAQQMIKDGWAVKYLNPRDEGDDATPYLPVAVNFVNKPPRIVMITSAAHTNLTEDSVEVLDYADIQKVDLVLNAYQWEVNEKSGVKAYLKSLFATIDEDPLELKYSQMLAGE